MKVNIPIPQFLSKLFAGPVLRYAMTDHAFVMDLKSKFNALQNNDEKADFVQTLEENGVRLPWVQYSDEGYRFYSEVDD